MLTFLPFVSFKESAKILDNRTLEESLMNAINIFDLIVNTNERSKENSLNWWENNIKSLAYYILTFADELYNRIGESELFDSSQTILESINFNIDVTTPKFVNKEICLSHKQMLLYKSCYEYKLFEFSNLNNLYLQEIIPTYQYVWNDFINYVYNTSYITTYYPISLNYPKLIASNTLINFKYEIYNNYLETFTFCEHKIELKW